MEAKRLNEVCSFLIASDFSRSRMGYAIDFDDKLAVERDKIYDISTDRMLSAKFPMRELSGAQGFP